MENEKIDFDKMEKDLAEMDARMKAREAQGLADIYKYFDRINDKLSTFNNMLIAGYFAMATFNANVSKLIVVIPLANMAILIYLDYIMMEQGRLLSQITTQPVSQISKYGSRQNLATWTSLLTILTTLAVTIIFLFLLNSVVIKK